MIITKQERDKFLVLNLEMIARFRAKTEILAQNPLLALKEN